MWVSTNARTLIRVRSKGISGFALALTGFLIVGCTHGDTPVSPSATSSTAPLSQGVVAEPMVSHNGAAHEEKGYIDGWIDGNDVRLHYTKLYFCAEPPASGADSGCEIGGDAEVAPRPGEMRKIYAIAAVGFQPPRRSLARQGASASIIQP